MAAQPDFTQASQYVNQAATEIQQQFQLLNTIPAVTLLQIQQQLQQLQQQLQQQLNQIHHDVQGLRTEMRAS